MGEKPFAELFCPTLSSMLDPQGHLSFSVTFTLPGFVYFTPLVDARFHELLEGESYATWLDLFSSRLLIWVSST
jgi:hypothetical protein